MKKVLLIISSVFAMISGAFASDDLREDLIGSLSMFSQKLNDSSISILDETVLNEFDYNYQSELVKKYTPKIKKYLNDVLDNLDIFVEQNGIDYASSKSILKMAIENVAYGDSPKMKEKRAILQEIYFDYLFKF